MFVFQLFQLPPRVLSPFRGGGLSTSIIDPDSYADWSFYTPGRVS